MRNKLPPLELTSIDDSEYDSDGISYPQKSLTLSIEKSSSKSNFTNKPDPKIDAQYSQLQELITIYDNIVKKSPSSSIKTRSLVNFFSAIACSLNIKQGKCTKGVKKKKFQKKKDKYDNLVAAFQELARSSLTLTQIASLNNITAGLQDYLKKDYPSIISDLTEMTKKGMCKKSNEKKKIINRGDEKKVKSDRSRPPQKNTQKRAKPQRRKSPESRKIKKKTEEISKVFIHPPPKLEDILKLGFCPQNSVKDSKKADLNEKLLVTVKLSGSEVLVNSFSYIENENMKKLPVSKKSQEISELIIENVSNDQNWFKNTKSRNLRILNRSLSEEKRQFQVKTPKKEIKVKRVTKRRTPLRKSEKVGILDSRFEYDQNRLRTQYPIEAIDEISEPEIIEDFVKRDSKLVVEKSQSRPKVQNKVVKKVLKRGISSNFGRGEGKLRRVNSCVIRRRLKSNSERKKTNPGVSKSMGCLKERMGPKKSPRMTSKSAIIPTKPAHSCSFRKIRTNSRKKASEGKKLKAEKSKIPLQVKTKTETPKPAENPVLYLTSDVIPQSSSIEFLFSESDAPSRADSDQLPLGPSETVNPEVPSSSTASDYLIQIQSSNSDEKSDCLERINDSPIAILPPSNCSEITSAPMELIHSDSFLINFPPLRVSRSKLKAFFKANSEVKFYPGRLVDNKAEETPLVKFVLTPKQYQEAGIPSNQVVVVSRPTKDDVDPQGEENNQESEIEQIEKFIQELSRLNKKKNREIQKSARQNFRQRKSLTNRLWKSSRSLCNRKVLHECEKRKLMNLNKKIKENAGTNSKSVRIKEQSTPKKSFTKEKLECLVGDRLEKSNIKKEKSTGETIKYKLKGLSMNPSEVTPELLEAVKATIKRAPDLTGKEEILAAIEEGFSKNQQEIMIMGEAETDIGTKKLNKLKIKIQRKKPPTPKGQFLETTKSYNQNSISPVKVSTEIPTIYFDAQETIEQEVEKKNDSTNLQPKGIPKLNVEETEENEEPNIDPTFISSLSDLLPESVCPDIMTTSYDCEKLKKVLAMIKSKSRDLMMKIESSVWMEVLMYLEEISQVIEDENNNIENFQPFFQKLDSINQSRMNNFRKGYSAFEKLKDEQTKKTFLDVLKKQLHLLTRKISFRSSTPEKQLSSSLSLPNLKKTKMTQSEETEARHLKRKLREHVYVLQELLKAEKTQETHTELKIQDMQKKIMEKLKFLEELGDTSKVKLKDSLMAMRILLELLKNYKDKKGRSSDGETSKKGGNFGFIDIMNSFITAWNAQTPITCVKSDYCHG